MQLAVMAVRLVCPLLLFCTILPIAELSHEMIIQQEKIVKLYDSKDRGARLLGRATAKERGECSHLCLAKDDCDTAVYHENTYDRQNCFFLSCGVPNKCVFADHTDFTVLLRTSADSKELEPVDCELTPWTVVAPCSVSCGHGMIIYRRTVLAEGKNGGQPCPGDDQLHFNESCSLSPCKVDCQLSLWTSFSLCSTSCGPGMRTRHRKILQTSSGGGVNCPLFESLRETVSCELKECLSSTSEDWDWHGVAPDVTTEVPTDIRDQGTGSIGATVVTDSSRQALAEEELNDVISKQFDVGQTKTLGGIHSPSPASSFIVGNSNPSTVVSTTRHPTAAPPSNLFDLLEQELNEVATEESHLHDADVELTDRPSQTASASSSHAPQTSWRPSLRVTQTPQTEAHSTRQSVSQTQMANSSSTELNATNPMHSTTYAPSVHVSTRTGTAQSAKPTILSEYTPHVAQATQIIVRTVNPSGGLLMTKEVSTGGTEGGDIKEGIELGVENKDSDGSSTTATAVLVVSLMVGIMFVIASFVMVGRRWYSSFRRRRRYTRMEYLINDVSD